MTWTCGTDVSHPQAVQMRVSGFEEVHCSGGDAIAYPSDLVAILTAAVAKNPDVKEVHCSRGDASAYPSDLVAILTAAVAKNPDVKITLEAPNDAVVAALDDIPQLPQMTRVQYTTPKIGESAEAKPTWLWTNNKELIASAKSFAAVVKNCTVEELVASKTSKVGIKGAAAVETPEEVWIDCGDIGEKAVGKVPVKKKALITATMVGLALALTALVALLVLLFLKGASPADDAHAQLHATVGKPSDAKGVDPAVFPLFVDGLKGGA